MPTAWVVWAVFAAVRLKLAEVAVPPGGALLEKLGALAPGATDILVRGAMNLARRSTAPTHELIRAPSFLTFLPFRHPEKTAHA